MKSVREVVKRSALRMGLDRGSQLLGWCLVVVAGAAGVGVLADRLLFLGRPVTYGILAVAGVTLVVLVVLTVRRWPRPIAAAIEVDRRLGLAERISSALAVEGWQDPMARAVVEDARGYASRVPVAETFPLRWHRQYWVALGLALLALGLSAYMPQYDLLARRARLQELEKERAAVRREARRMRRELNKLKRQVELGDFEEAQAHLERTEEVIRRMEKGRMSRAEALAELSKLAETLKAARQGLSRGDLVPKGMLGKRGLGPTQKLTQALAQRDFQAARRELSQLAQQASAEERRSAQQWDELKEKLEELLRKLSEADQKKLAERLKRLSEQADQEQLTPEQLERLKEELAKLAQELGKKNLTALSDEVQKLLTQVAGYQQSLAGLAQLQDELSALAQSLSQSPGLSGALSSLARALSEEDAQALRAALKAALLEFDSLEDLETQLAILSAFQGLCKSGKQGLAENLLATWSGTGIYSEGESRNVGPGMGGPGIGIGGKAPVEPEEVSFEPTRIKGRVRPGRVVGSFFAGGVQLKGEARLEYQKTVKAAAQEAAEAIQKEQIPRAYKEYVRGYFQELTGE